MIWVFLAGGTIAGWQSHRFYLRRLYGAMRKIRQQLRGGQTRRH